MRQFFIEPPKAARQTEIKHFHIVVQKDHLVFWSKVRHEIKSKLSTHKYVLQCYVEEKNVLNSADFIAISFSLHHKKIWQSSLYFINHVG